MGSDGRAAKGRRRSARPSTADAVIPESIGDLPPVETGGRISTAWHESRRILDYLEQQSVASPHADPLGRRLIGIRVARTNLVLRQGAEKSAGEASCQHQ